MMARTEPRATQPEDRFRNLAARKSPGFEAHFKGTLRPLQTTLKSSSRNFRNSK
jgi:hypothetical protein